MATRAATPNKRLVSTTRLAIARVCVALPFVSRRFWIHACCYPLLCLRREGLFAVGIDPELLASKLSRVRHTRRSQDAKGLLKAKSPGSVGSRSSGATSMLSNKMFGEATLAEVLERMTAQKAAARKAFVDTVGNPKALLPATLQSCDDQHWTPAVLKAAAVANDDDDDDDDGDGGADARGTPRIDRRGSDALLKKKAGVGRLM